MEPVFSRLDMRPGFSDQYPVDVGIVPSEITTETCFIGLGDLIYSTAIFCLRLVDWQNRGYGCDEGDNDFELHRRGQGRTEAYFVTRAQFGKSLVLLPKPPVHETDLYLIP